MAVGWNDLLGALAIIFGTPAAMLQEIGGVGVVHVKNGLDRALLVIGMDVIGANDAIAHPVSKVAGLFGRAGTVVQPAGGFGTHGMSLKLAFDSAPLT